MISPEEREFLEAAERGDRPCIQRCLQVINTLSTSSSSLFIPFFVSRVFCHSILSSSLLLLNSFFPSKDNSSPSHFILLIYPLHLFLHFRTHDTNLISLWTKEGRINWVMKYFRMSISISMHSIPWEDLPWRSLSIMRIWRSVDLFICFCFRDSLFQNSLMLFVVEDRNQLYFSSM